MKRVIPARAAANTLLIGFGALLIFHMLMLAGALPPGIVWGGRAGNPPQSTASLEVMSLVVTLVFAVVVAARIGYLGRIIPRGVAVVGTWAVFAYLALNVVGNLTSTSTLERGIFTPISALLAVMALRLAIE